LLEFDLLIPLGFRTGGLQNWGSSELGVFRTGGLQNWGSSELGVFRTGSLKNRVLRSIGQRDGDLRAAYVLINFMFD
jgi:hypothetical protein